MGKTEKLLNTFACFLESVILFFLTFFIKRRSSYVAIGSWKGQRYADNSRYLAEYIVCNRPDLTVLWIGNKSIKKEVTEALPTAKFLEKDRFRTNVALLRCKYMFFSQMHDADISKYNVYRGAITCYLHHGMTIKKWGQDGLSQVISDDHGIRGFIKRVTGANLHYDYFVTSSPPHERTNCSGLTFKGCTGEKNIHSGTPRDDMYFRVNKQIINETKKHYANVLQFESEKRVIMYLPTYRRTATNVFSFSTLTKDEREKVLIILDRYNCILIEKSHMAEKNTFAGKNSGNQTICAPSEMNVQEMMLFADCLISDYSGAYLDYILLDRPVIHFAYDYDYYRNVDSGLYYEIDDFAAGPIAYSFDELLKAMEEVLAGIDTYSEKREYVRKKYMTIYRCIC